jgi:hypothetical protein
MADSEFSRFKKMFPRGTKDMNIQAIPAPLPGPGGIVRGAVQSGVRRFSDVNKGDKTTKMKTRQGTERKDPKEPRVVPSGRSEALKKAREGGGGVTKMKDRRGLERKPDAPRKMSTGRKAAIGAGVAASAVSGIELAKRMKARSAVARDRVESNQSVQRSSYNMKNPTQRPYDASTSPKRDMPPKPKARPAAKKAEKRKPEKKSKIRIAFEKEFAAARRSGKKKFSSKLGKYGVYSTKLK